MTPRDYADLFAEVLMDWRVIAATLAMLLSWAILRSVGVVFRRRLPQRMRKVKKAVAAVQAPASSEPSEKP